MPPKPQSNMDIPDILKGSHGPNPPGFQSNESAIPWAEIFSRHEFLLSSHLDLLGTVKGHISPDGEAFRTVSTMVNKTVQAMNQFKVVRKHMLHKNATDGSETASNMNTQSTSVPQNPDVATKSQTKSQKKRSRAEQEKDRASTEYDAMPRDDATEDAHASKRKRDARSHPSEDLQSPEDQTSTPQDTEDISEEVQRRLRIKEERRRKRDTGKPEKRKRESLLSNESSSPYTARPKKKRARPEEELRPEQQLGLDGDSDHSKKQRKKTRGT